MMKTVVLQSFRTRDVAAWMERCMASVRAWAAFQGYDYEFMDDRIFDLCGAEYLAQVGDNKRSITNLARLELIRLRLAGAYERAIWLDADTFVFAPAKFRMDIDTGYAFAREVWVYRNSSGNTFVDHSVHNASCVFCRNQPDLDFFIRTIRYIAATREVHESFRIGVRLLTGLQYPLGFPLIQDSAMCSPEILQALARGDERLLAILARGHAHPVHAANLCWSKLGASPGLVEASEDIVVAAMDRLEQSAGAVINRYCPVTERSAAGGGPVTVTTAGMARGREDMSAFLESPVWLLTQACRRLAVQVLPRR